MSEFITIQVGQCGNQIGDTFWPLVLQEYGIQKVSHLKSSSSSSYDFISSFRSFFWMKNETSNNFKTYDDLKTAKVKARTILVDMEDGVISRIRSGPLKFLYDQKFIITNYPGSGNNWAEGYCYHGPKYEELLLNALRKSVDKCDNLHGFLIMFSAGGGTGSGVGSYILKLLSDYYPHLDRFVIAVYPIGTEDVITCPYNMSLCTQKISEYAHCVFPVENRALFEIVNRQTKNIHSMDTIDFISKCKPFQDMNSIIVNMLLHLTSGSRFPGNLNVDLNDIHTNMVPFPNMQYLSSGYSPLTVSSPKIIKKANNQIKDEIFMSACSRTNQLLKIDPIGAKSTILGSTFIGRGDYTIDNMRHYVDKLQNKGRFTIWSKKAIKTGLCNIAPIGHNAAMLSLFNTSVVTHLFSTVHKQFSKLYTRKAHIHHYNNVAGFDPSYFQDCEENLLSYIDSYHDLDLLQPTEVPRLFTLPK